VTRRYGPRLHAHMPDARSDRSSRYDVILFFGGGRGPDVRDAGRFDGIVPVVTLSCGEWRARSIAPHVYLRTLVADAVATPDECGEAFPAIRYGERCSSCQL